MNKITIKDVIYELLELLKTSDTSSIKVQFDILKLLNQEDNINIIERVVSEKKSSLFPPTGGLTDFYVWTGDDESDRKKNKKISELSDIIWKKCQ